MANLELLKDPRSIASASALVAVGVSYAYFNNEINKIKEEQDEISREIAEFKRHVSSLLLAAPDSSRQIEKIITAVKNLDSRIGEIRGVNPVEPKGKGYQRLTARSNVVKEDYIDDMDEDIAAMTA